MELTWWPVLLVGLAGLVGAAAWAWTANPGADRTQLRPLANVHRLTTLPEYVRVYRIYVASVMATVVLLLMTFATVLLAGARPTGLPASTQAFDAAYPQDTMLCLGQDVTDPTSAQFLTHYARLAESFDKQRLGLTSQTLRVIPLTRDHTYVTARLQGLARLARIQQDLDGGQPVSDADRAELQARAGEFSRPVDYTDYARSTEDVLALCMTGFPDSEPTAALRRQLVYLGPSSLRDPADERQALYSADAVRRLAEDADVQINVIARTDVAESSPGGTDALRSLAEATGGIFQRYAPPDESLDLEAVDTNPPAAQLSDGQVITSSSWDTPEPVLAAALVAAVLLSLSLVVLRR